MSSHDLQEQCKDDPSLSGTNAIQSSTVIINESSVGTTTTRRSSHEEDVDEPTNIQWMRKMMTSDRKSLMATKHIKLRRRGRRISIIHETNSQDQQKTQNRDSSSSGSSKSNNSSTRTTAPGFIRVCSECNTTKTPLWRSGPHGPRSLCNACGIRQRKERRAMAAAAAATAATAAGGTLTWTPADHNYPNCCYEVQKEEGYSEGSSFNILLPSFKNECKSFNKDQICEVAPADNSLHRAFPQDEKDAAILLMTLSSAAIMHS